MHKWVKSRKRKIGIKMEESWKKWINKEKKSASKQASRDAIESELICNSHSKGMGIGHVYRTLPT